MKIHELLAKYRHLFDKHTDMTIDPNCSGKDFQAYLEGLSDAELYAFITVIDEMQPILDAAKNCGILVMVNKKLTDEQLEALAESI